MATSLDAADSRQLRADSQLVTVLIGVLCLLVFLFDTAVPLGVAGGVPYITAVVLAIYSGNRRTVLTTAAICTILTLAGYLISPGAGSAETWKIIANRSLAILAIWTPAALSASLPGELRKQQSRPTVFLAFASLFTFVMLISMNWLFFRTEAHTEELMRRENALGKLSNRIIHLDQMLTMSARMAAATGELDWEQKYREYEQELDQLFQQASSIVDSSINTSNADASAAANSKLVALENQVFELIRNNRLSAAVAILDSAEYLELKSVYQAGMEQYQAKLLAANEVAAQEHQRNMWLHAALSTVALGAFICIWIYGALLLKNWKRSELQLRGLLEQRAENLAIEAHWREEVQKQLVIAAGELEQQLDEVEKSKETAEQTLEKLEQSQQQILRSEQHTKDQAARIEAIVECASDAIITVDRVGTVETFNSAAERIFGYQTGEVIGQNVKMLMPAPYRDEHDGYLQRYLETGEKHIIGIGREAVGLRKDGSVFPMDLAISEVELGDRNLFTGIVRDITDRKVAEDIQAQLHRELSQKAQEIEMANTVLQRSNEELKQFAYVASHDLQEPLRKVNSFCQLLKEEYGDVVQGEGAEYLRYITEGATRMRRLVADLLEYSRVETKGKPLEPTSATDACNEAIENLSATIEEHNVLLSVGKLPVIEADYPQLVRLFQNLIGNAIKYRGDADPVISVQAREEEDAWVISVQDNGIGIEPDYFDRIFVMFQRLHGRDEYSGTGIGLAICKRIVDRLWGRIWVESEFGVGSTFYISVPKFLDIPNEGAIDDESADASTGSTYQHSAG